MAAPGQNYPMNPGQYPPQNYPPQQPGYYQAPPQQPGYYQGPPQQTPAGQYPGYPQAQPYPQPGYAVQGTQMTTTVIQQPVVTQQPVALQHVPVSMRCPHCGATIVTKLDHRVGQTTFAYCCMLSCFGCCWVPFCTECAKDVGHTCPNCQKELGVFKRKIVAESDGRGNKHNYDFHYGGPADDYVGPSDD